MRALIWILLAVAGFVVAAYLSPGPRGATDAGARRPADVSGRARVIDGDSISVGHVEVRLHGVDAPEGAQTCLDGGARWPCGRKAAQALRGLIDGRTVACEELDKDAYGRVVATCRSDGVDIGAWLVENGWALAYRRHSQAYVGEESLAKSARRGVWRGEFDAPWNWRQAERQRQGSDSRRTTVAAAPSSGRCTIKGNISHSSGKRLYHVPGDPGYADTRISASRGERWFCSEAEARASGWKRAGS